MEPPHDDATPHPTPASCVPAATLVHPRCMGDPSRPYVLTRGRLGLRPATATQWGMMRLTTIGRRSGQARKAILGYFEDGPNLVTMAMNGWGEPEPAWWLNLQANPDTTVELPDGPRAVHGRAATPDERPRLWARWAVYDGENLDAWAARRPRETAVVILEPRAGR
jgi:deazaflavin-dependent oxidoreductase (nitroreductase family)